MLLYFVRNVQWAYRFLSSVMMECGIHSRYEYTLGRTDYRQRSGYEYIEYTCFVYIMQCRVINITVVMYLLLGRTRLEISYSYRCVIIMLHAAHQIC